MFRNLLDKIGIRLAGDEEFDPSSIDDPVARKTDWSPAKKGGANFYSHRLVVVNFNRLEFRATVLAKFISLLVLCIGLFLLMLFVYHSFISNESYSGFGLFMILLGSIMFSLAGCYLVFVWAAPAIFDKSVGYFWKGRKRIDQLDGSEDPENVAALRDIHAIQLISEYCSGSDTDGNGNPYTSYELNLVFHNGERINVVDHSDENHLREEAETLSIFLDKPVWDGILE
jgi:hypothetical protein